MDDDREPPPADETDASPAQVESEASPSTSAEADPLGPRPTIAIASVLRRTFDTFLAHPITFVVLAIPGAFASVLALGSSGDPNRAGDVVRAYGVILVTQLIAAIFGLAIVAATDADRTGSVESTGSALRRGLSRAVVGMVSVVAEGFAFLGLSVGLTLLALILAGAGLGAVALILVVLGSLGLIFVGIRWALAPAAILLDRRGPVAALNHSWNVTRGRALRLVGLFIIIGLIVLPLDIGIALLAGTMASPAPALVIGAIAALVTTPIAVIAPATAYGDLTARPIAPPVTPASPVGRRVLVGTVLAFGIVGVVLGAINLGPAIDHAGLALVPAADRGVVRFATTSDPSNPCSLPNPKTTFSTSEPVWLGGYFTKAVPAGQTARIDVFMNGTKAGTTSLSDPSAAFACFSIKQALTGLDPASYRVVVSLGSESIAEGSFIVQ